jgi:hypothetical protein
MSSDVRDDSGHGRFREMCALAVTGALTGDELVELKLHLEKCHVCGETLSQYRALGTEGLAALAGNYAEPHESQSWDDSASWKKLLARMRADQKPAMKTSENMGVARPGWLRRIRARWFKRTARNEPSSGSM